VEAQASLRDIRTDQQLLSIRLDGLVRQGDVSTDDSVAVVSSDTEMAAMLRDGREWRVALEPGLHRTRAIDDVVALQTGALDTQLHAAESGALICSVPGMVSDWSGEAYVLLRNLEPIEVSPHVFAISMWRRDADEPSWSRAGVDRVAGAILEPWVLAGTERGTEILSLESGGTACVVPDIDDVWGVGSDGEGAFYAEIGAFMTRESRTVCRFEGGRWEWCASFGRIEGLAVSPRSGLLVLSGDGVHELSPVSGTVAEYFALPAEFVRVSADPRARRLSSGAECFAVGDVQVARHVVYCDGDDRTSLDE
jgi:hypothetical protein